jgi:hypothetical protein
VARELSILDVEGVQYYVDTRLEEFRPVDNPHEHIPFDSERGMVMVEEFYQAFFNTIVDGKKGGATNG